MKFRLPKTMLAILGVGLACSAQAATLTKANNTTTLNLAGSWVENAAPTTADTLLWNSTVAGANSTAIGANLSVLGLQVTNPAGAITIASTASATLTLGTGGIDMSTATQNLSVLTNISFGGDSSVQVGSGRTLTLGANGSTITYAAGTTTTFTGAGTTLFQGNSTNAVNILGNITIASGATLVNNMQGGSSTGTGTVTINGNYYTQTSVAGLGSGAVIIGAGAAIGGGSGGNGARTIANATTIAGDFSIANQGASTSQVTLSGTMDLGGAVRQITATGSHTISGIVSNGGITKAGAGTLTLSGANIYAGGTTVNAGTLTVGNAAGLGTGTVTVNGGTLNINGQTLANAITVGSSGAISGNGTLNAALTGSGTMTKTGAADLIMNAAGNSLAALSVSQGKLVIAGSGSLSITGAYSSSSSSSKGSLDLASGATLNSGSVFSSWGTDMVVNGTLTTGGFTFSGGTSTVTGTGKINVSSLTNQNYGTSNLNGATFNIGSGGITSNTALNLGATTLGATANWTSTAAMGLTNAVNGTTINTLDSVDGTTGRNITLSGVLSGTGSLNKVGAGTLTLAGASANTYSGGTTINDGNVVANKANALGASSGTVTVNGGTLNLNGQALGNKIVINGGSVIGASAYTGTLAGAGGSFDAGTSAIKTYTVDVAGLTLSSLSGQGIFTGGLVSVTGTHNPGNSPGTQTFETGLSYGSDSVVNLEIQSDGSLADSLIVKNGLTIGSNVTLNVSLFGSSDYANAYWDTDRSFKLIDVSGGTTGSFTSLNNTLGGGAEGSWLITQDSTGVTASWTANAIPEPSSLGLLGVGMAGMLLRRRRKQA